jgi:formylglycine-generating enzyme required for sulfatase activity
LRVIRGGSWGDDPRTLRVAGRGTTLDINSNVGIGFRLVRTLTP